MPRKTVYISIGFLSGLFLSFYLETRYILAIIALLGLVIVLCLLMDRAVRSRILLVICAALTAIFYSQAYSNLALRPIERLDGEAVLVEGVVLEATVSDSSSVIIKGTVNGMMCKMSAYISNFSGDIGDRVSFEAKARTFESGAFFDERSYYLPDGIFLSVSPESEISVTTPKRATFSTVLRNYSRLCADRLREYIGGDAGDLICAMATGDRSYLADSVRLAINRTGLGHIIAVSGLHVSVACAFLIGIAKKLRIDRRISVVLSGVFVVAFVVFSGLKVSAIRAAIMMAVYILSILARRRSDPLNTLSFCALIMAALNPYIVADASFVLSVSGVFGVSVFAPFVCDSMKIKSKILRSFISAICTCISTAPAMMLYFNELSLVAPLANFLLLPVCSAIIVLALLFIMLGCAPFLTLIPKIAGVLAEIMIWLCEKVSSQRLSYLPMSFKTPIIIVIILSLATPGLYALLKSKKAVLLSVIVAVTLFGVSYAGCYLESRGKTEMSLIVSGDDSIMLLRKNEECIIIDVNGGVSLADECEDICERMGITRVLLASANESGEAAYSQYAGMSVKPERLLLPDGSYIFGGDIPYDYLGEVTCLSFADCEITLSSDGILIEHGAESIAICNGAAKGADINISVFDGVLVINEEAHVGDGIISIEF